VSADKSDSDEFHDCEAHELKDLADPNDNDSLEEAVINGELGELGDGVEDKEQNSEE